MAAARTNRKSITRPSLVSKMMSTSAFMTAGVLAFSGAAMADASNPWADVSAVTGSLTSDLSVINQNTITQHSDRTVATAGSGDILSNQTVNILQNNSGSLFVLKTTGADQDGSQIHGALNANGRVMILDRNGVFFGAGSRVDVGGIVASTGDVDNNAVMRGDEKLTISNFGDASVINNGIITANGSGLSALVAPHVANNGVIQAKVGKVALAAGGESATVDLYGDGLVELAVGGKTGKALAENAGTIEGATVLMTASGAKDVVDTVINMSGVIKATSATVKGGKIVLGGGNAGKVKVSGTLDASGATGGGSVHVTGKTIEVADTAKVKADAVTQGNGGDIYFMAEENGVYQGDFSARGGAQSGNGGAIELSAKNEVGFDGSADTRAPNGTAGTFLIDPKFSIIHSGKLNNLLGFQLFLSAEAIAKSLFTNGLVTVQADDFIDVGTDTLGWIPGVGTGDIDLSKHEDWRLVDTDPRWWVIKLELQDFGGTTTGDLKLVSDTVNFNKNLTLGTGNLIVDANTVNLNSQLKDINGLLKATDITSNATLVNVLSNAAYIQQGLSLATTGATVNVAADTYTEQLNINKDVTLKGAGADKTIINAPTNLTKSYTQDGREVYAVVHAHDANINIDGIQVNGATNTGNTYTTDKRFVGVAYQNAGGNFTNNIVTGILTANNSTRTGFAFLATDKTGAASTLNVVGNTFKGFQQYGVALADNVIVNLTNNDIVGDKDAIAVEQSGVYVTSGAKVTAENNRISNTDTGVEIVSSANGTYTGNTLSGVHNGFSATNSANTKLVNNTIGGNSTTGVNLVNSSGSSVTGGSIDSFVTGVNVNNSNNVTIDGVTLTNISDTHIKIADSSNAKVQKNTMTGGKTGIALKNVTNSTIGGADSTFANTIQNTQSGWGNTGINISKGDNLTIANNVLKDIGGQGIYAEDSYGNVAKTLDIKNNTITNAEHNAISIKQWNGANVAANAITGTTYGNGVQLEQTTGTKVAGNTIVDAKAAGVALNYGNDGVAITGNTITNAKNGISVGDNSNTMIGSFDSDPTKTNTITGGEVGILADGGSNLWIQGNNVSGTSDAGIDVKNIGGSYAMINHNVVNASKDGIRVTNTKANIADNRIGLVNDLTGNGIVLTDGDNSLIASNQISNVALDGIKAISSDGVSIATNEIGLAGNVSGNGVVVADSNNAEVKGNKISNAGKTGIRINRGANVDVTGNTLTKIGNEGIRTEQVQTLNVSNNSLTNVSWNGIEVQGGKNAAVESNTLTTIRGNGIQISNTQTKVDVNKNTVKDVRLDGITLTSAQNQTISENNVDVTGGNGITVNGGTNAVVTKNKVGLNGGAITNNGIAVKNTNSTKLLQNEVAGGKIGVVVNGGGNLWVEENKVTKSSDAGIDVSNSGGNFTIVQNNDVNDTKDGIRVTDSTSIITNNRIGLTTGLTGNGIVSKNSNESLIAANQIKNVALDGIKVDGGDKVAVESNIVANAGLAGIHALNTSNLTVGGVSAGRGNTTTGGKNGIRVENATGTTTIRHNNTSGATDTNAGRTAAYTTGVGILVSNTTGTVTVSNNQSNGNMDGIRILKTNDAVVTANTTNSNSDKGIIINDSDRVAVTGNTADQNKTGLWVELSQGVTLDNNDVTRSKAEGVHLRNSQGTVVNNNRITGNLKDGVFVDRSNGTTLTKNTITGSNVSTGIKVEGSNNAVIGTLTDGNDVSRFATGVSIDGGLNNAVTNNVVHDVAATGIYLNNVKGQIVANNKVDKTSADGISVNGGTDANVHDNEVGLNGGGIIGNGILVKATNLAQVIKNKVTGGKNGVKLENATNAVAEENVITGTTGGWGNAGITVKGGSDNLVQNNVVNASAGNGILSDGSNNVDIVDNVINGAAQSGIQFYHSNGATISGNEVYGSDYGISGETSNNVSILANTIGTAGTRTLRNGIDLWYGVNDATITGNTIFATENAISLGNTGGQFNDNAIIDANIIDGGKNGVVIDGGTNQTVENNTISNVSNIGVSLNDVQSAKLTSNVITNSGAHGLFATGQNNGSIVLVSNTFTDNLVGAEFESGQIDLSGVAGDENVFNGGQVALRFAPAVGANPLGLSLVGNTIGETMFTGQSQYYVELLNGALFAPGTPTIINGLDATYDGFKPSTVGGVLTQAQYDAIEAKIFHYNDNQSLGLFDFGTVPSIDDEDAYNRYGAFTGAAARFRVTLVGLPRLPGAGTGPVSARTQAPGFSGNVADFLANLAPAAGGETTSSTTTSIDAVSQLASIEPAAGANDNADVTCWGQAASQASAGAAVSYSFGGTMEESLNQAAACGGGI